MGLVVQKYGGTSLASPRHIQRAALRIERLKAAGHHVVVVVSAMGHTTDHLLRLAKKTVKKPPGRELDMLLTAGERVSMSLLAMALQERGVQAISLTGSQSGILTDERHTAAKIRSIKGERIRENLAAGRVVIIAGFQGVSEHKEVTTLGRGGSDTTAVALAAVLKAETCEILTDVDGIFTADPRYVPGARRIPECSFETALELATLGAKMHPRSLALAKRFQVPVRVYSSFLENSEGTWVRAVGASKMESARVVGIAHRAGFSFVRLKVPRSQWVPFVAEFQIQGRFLQADESGVRFLVDEASVEEVAVRASVAQLPIDVVRGVCVLSIVGEALESSQDTAVQLLTFLERQKISAYLFSQTSASLSIVVADSLRDTLLPALHAEFLPV